MHRAGSTVLAALACLPFFFTANACDDTTSGSPPGVDASLEASQGDANLAADTSPAADVSVDVGPDAYDAGPPKERIAYVFTNDIWVMDVDGSNKTNLTSSIGVNDVEPCWSPDRSKIAFRSDADEGSGEIYVMNADGSGRTRLTTNVGVLDGAPAWSPDGTKIAFVRGSAIFVMNSNGSGAVAVTNSPPASDSDPSWSPDGSKIAFTTNEGGIGLHIGVIGSSGTGRDGLATNRAFGVKPAWSKDGLKIAFAADTKNGPRIFLMNPDGSGQAQLTDSANTTQNETDPDYAPDGAHVVFSRNISAQTHIMRLSAGGAVEIDLSTSQPGASDPNW